MIGQWTCVRIASVGVFMVASSPCLAQHDHAPPEPPQATEPGAGLVDVLPGLRVDRAEGVLEFDGTIPIEIGEKARTFLEVIVCGKDTREHETLVVTDVKASALHAGLLLLGWEPGAPGTWNRQGEKPVAIAPRGTELEVRLVVNTPQGEREVDPMEWIAHAHSGRTLRAVIDAKRAKSNTAKGEDSDAELPATAGERAEKKSASAESDFVFAGSVFVPSTKPGESKEIYKADLDGTLIGLHTFSSETIAWKEVHDPDAGAEEPVWIANTAPMGDVGLKRGDAVRVRVRSIKPEIKRQADDPGGEGVPRPSSSTPVPSGE